MTINEFVGIGFRRFESRLAKGCGCGKKVSRPQSSPSPSIARVPAGVERTAAAKTFQSGTMPQSPKGPVTGGARKTV